MQAKMEHPEAQARKDQTAHLATLAQTDHEVTPEYQLLALQLLLVTPDLLDLTDHPAQLVNPDLVVTTEPPALPVQRDHPDQTEDPARMVLPATKAHPDQMVQRESLVFARNTALWTAASSSKTEQDVKKRLSHLNHWSVTSFLQSRSNGYGESSLLLAIHPFLPSILCKLTSGKFHALFKF